VLASQTILDWFWRDTVGFFNCLVTMDETSIHICIWSRDQKTTQGMETKWFPVSKEVQYTEVIKQGVGILSSGTKMEFCL
jgi:hypothetical protein